jgi:hypothetical protein
MPSATLQAIEVEEGFGLPHDATSMTVMANISSAAPQ